MNDAFHTTLDGSVFVSFLALRAAHRELLIRRREGRDSPELLAAAEDFIRRGRASGALLDGIEDRASSQSLLDYWSNIIYLAGVEPPDATLAEFDPLLAPQLSNDSCPYLGLDSFHEHDHTRFFGRQQLVADLIMRLADRRLLAVVGPSGAGKSSVVRAGLVPTLKAGALPGSQDWLYYPPIVPGSNPLANLARIICPPGVSVTEWINRRIADFHQRSDYLGRLMNLVKRPAVFIIDQFEEVFTLCDDHEVREAFVANLLSLIQAPSVEHTVVLTMRSDFETFVARLPELQTLFERGRMQVTQLSASGLREAIEKPAMLVGLKFEAGVVDALLQDILGEPAGLPLLQFTLLRLWDLRERNRVTLDVYRRLGGGRLALARSADAFYDQLIPEDQVTAKRILLRLIRPGEGLEITSSRIRRDSLYRGGEARDRVDRVLDKLVQVRLIRLIEGETLSDNQVEVAHEALVRNWPGLVEWLEEERAAITVRRRLEAKAAEWVRLGRGIGGLLDEIQLLEAERWLTSLEADYLGYNESVPALVQASRTAYEAALREQEAARQRELEQARALAEEQRRRAEELARLTRRLRWLVLALVIMFIVMAAALTFALTSARG